MGNSGPYLALDIVADYRQSPPTESVLPVFFLGDKYRNAIDKATSCGQYLLDIPLSGFFASHGKEVDYHIGSGFF